MDNYTLTATATLLRQIPEKQIHATDKLRLAWQLLADAFRHTHLKDPRYASLRELITATHHVRYSEPLAFLQFASATSADDEVRVAAVDSTGFRDEVCHRAILHVADWADSIAQLVDDEGQMGYLDLIVNPPFCEARRRGYTGVVQFQPESAEWHMFFSAWQAGEAGVSREEMLDGYPADSASDARRSVKQNANRQLAILGVRLAPNKPPVLEVVPRR